MGGWAFSFRELLEMNCKKANERGGDVGSECVIGRNIALDEATKKKRGIFNTSLK
jgi:hypothetical protein